MTSHRLPQSHIYSVFSGYLVNTNERPKMALLAKRGSTFGSGTLLHRPTRSEDLLGQTLRGRTRLLTQHVAHTKIV